MRFTETDQYQLLHSNANLLYLYIAINMLQILTLVNNAFLYIIYKCFNFSFNICIFLEPLSFLHFLKRKGQQKDCQFSVDERQSINFFTCLFFPWRENGDLRSIKVAPIYKTEECMTLTAVVKGTSAQAQLRYYHISRTSPKIHPK